MRAVLDLNVLVSSVISDGPPAELMKSVTAGQTQIVVCPLLIEELREVLPRPKFARFLSHAEADAFITRLRDQAVEEPDPVAVPALSRDPDDDCLVALAVASGADVLASGDLDLLELENPPVRVLTPAAALAELV